MLQYHLRRRFPVLLLAPFLASAGSAQPDEFTLKAALSYNFAKYTEWPDSAMERYVELCYLNAGYQASFAPLVGRPVGDRTVRVRWLGRPEDVDGCDLLYLDAEYSSAQEELLGLVQGRPILTVADFQGFLDRGGMIEIQTVDNRLRFRVHQGKLQGGGITLSPQLLILATEVVK